MFRLALVAVCSFGFGVALVDTLHEPQAKAHPVAQQAVVRMPPSLVIPYSAQVCQDSGGKAKCKWYVSGTAKKELR